MNDNGSNGATGVANGDVDRIERGLYHTQTEVSTLKTDVGYIRRDLAGFGEKLDLLAKAFTDSSKIKWQPVGIVITSVFALVSLLSLVIALYVTSVVNPLANTANAAATAIGALTGEVRQVELTVNSNVREVENSRTDRVQINDRLQKLETSFSTEMAERKAATAEFRASLVGIETQICMSKELGNLMHANDLRNYAYLMRRTTGGIFPTDNAYYPPCHPSPRT